MSHVIFETYLGPRIACRVSVFSVGPVSVGRSQHVCSVVARLLVGLLEPMEQGFVCSLPREMLAPSYVECHEESSLRGAGRSFRGVCSSSGFLC